MEVGSQTIMQAGPPTGFPRAFKSDVLPFLEDVPIHPLLAACDGKSKNKQTNKQTNKFNLF